MSSTVIGILKNKKNAKVTTTLYTCTDFEDYYKTSEDKSVLGRRCEVIYLGEYDVTELDLEVGSEIEIYFDKAITLPNGSTIQRIKRVEVIN